jgi:Putative auto-transporter adhesin, head GIN domain
MKTWMSLPLAALLAVAGCSQMIGSTAGSGTPATVRRELAGFDAVRMSCHCRLKLTAQAATQTVTVTADDNVVPLITTEVRDGTLYIEASQFYIEKTPVLLEIGVATLTRLHFSGAGEIDLADLKSDSLDITVSGAGRVTATGEAKRLDLSLSGAASIEAPGLKAASVRAHVSGVGNIDTWASDSLDASVSGVGKISYGGTPQHVSTHFSGVGSIQHN